MFHLGIPEAAQITCSVKCKKHWSNRWKVCFLYFCFAKIKYIFMINSNTLSYRYFSSIIKAQLSIQIIARIVFFLKGRQGKRRIPWRCITNPDPSIQMCRWYFAGCCFSSCTRFFFNHPSPLHIPHHLLFCKAKQCCTHPTGPDYLQ